MSKLKTNAIQDMVTHQLHTPAGGYLGSDYGQNINLLLQRPLSEGAADAVIAKLMSDVPVLKGLPPNSVNIYSAQTVPDQLDILIEVAGALIQVPDNVLKK